MSVAMARRYDSRTTIFSPEGRLYQVRVEHLWIFRRRALREEPAESLSLPVRFAQVEYAIEAISHAGSAVGILSTEGVVLAAEKKILSKARGAGRPRALSVSVLGCRGQGRASGAAPPWPRRCCRHVARRGARVVCPGGWLGGDGSGTTNPTGADPPPASRPPPPAAGVQQDG